MEWAIITIYISKCAQMNPQQLPKTPKFYSRCKKCDIEKTLWGWVPPLGSPTVKAHSRHSRQCDIVRKQPKRQADKIASKLLLQKHACSTFLSKVGYCSKW